MKHINIPIFIQHMGCPNQCVFCDQRAISGAHSFCFEKVRSDIEQVLSTAGESECEIAFFGGSFTGIDRNLMVSLLDLAEEYVKDGKVCGIRMSTRPDYISEEIADILHKYTVSQIEIGFQSFSDDVLKKCKRGHTTQSSFRCAEILKKEGFSFAGQMMTGLPGADTETEKMTAKTICELGADAFRLYPCIVFKNTELERMTDSGEYIPMSVDEAVERSAEVLKVFLDGGLRCLKIGLHESENLHSSDTYKAGPNHPALGDMIRGKVYLDKILDESKNIDLEGKNAVIYVPAGAVSTVTGQNRRNKLKIIEKTEAKSVKILEMETLSEYNISVKYI